VTLAVCAFAAASAAQATDGKPIVSVPADHLANGDPVGRHLPLACEQMSGARLTRTSGRLFSPQNRGLWPWSVTGADQGDWGASRRAEGQIGTAAYEGTAGRTVRRMTAKPHSARGATFGPDSPAVGGPAASPRARGMLKSLGTVWAQSVVAEAPQDGRIRKSFHSKDLYSRPRSSIG
jgi:hypothetical protein